MRKWSVKEFEGLIRHQLTDAQGPVELIAGEIVPLPGGEQIDRQITLLTQQIARHLDEQGLTGFEVRSHYPLHLDDYSVLKPAIALIEHTSSTAPLVHWVLDICETAYEHSPDNATRASLYAQYAVAEYWMLCVDQVELRIKTGLTEAAYQNHRLLMVGEQASPLKLPQLRLRVQEPLPLYFLTRTLQGQRTYIGSGVPLQVANL